MAIPTDAEVKGWIHEEVLLTVRKLPVWQAALERAESAFSGPDYTAAYDALDAVQDQLMTALGATD